MSHFRFHRGVILKDFQGNSVVSLGFFLNFWLECLDNISAVAHDHKIVSPKCCTNTGFCHLQRGVQTADFCLHLLNLHLHWIPWFLLVSTALGRTTQRKYIPAPIFELSVFLQFTMSHQFSNSGPSCHSALRNSVSFEAESVQGASNSDLNSDGEAVRGTEGSVSPKGSGCGYDRITPLWSIKGRKIALYFRQQEVSVNKITSFAFLWILSLFCS